MSRGTISKAICGEKVPLLQNKFGSGDIIYRMINQRFDEQDKRFKEIESRFEKHDKKFEQFHQEIKDTNQRLDTTQLRMPQPRSAESDMGIQEETSGELDEIAT